MPDTVASGLALITKFYTMKLRIKGNTLRIRLSQSEVEHFDKEGFVSDSAHFPGAKTLVYEIKSTAAEVLNCSFVNNKISIEVPQPLVNEWINTELVGFDKDIDLENNSKLSILVEKDFNCLTKRQGEDESDLYPNPLRSH